MKSMFEMTNDMSTAVLDEVERKTKLALKAIGQNAEKYAKKKCPVGTPESTGIKGYIGGTLRNSIANSVRYNTVYIGTNVEYAPYQELGTSRGIKPKHFLRDSVKDHVDEYKDIIEKTLNG